MSVGFTGTRQGMTVPQEVTVQELLSMLLLDFGPEFRHGAADGADKQARAIARAVGYQEQPFPAGDDPLSRNRVIVDGAQFMLAVPRGNCEEVRSGTWMTIRYANQAGCPGLTIWPDGTCSPLTVKKKPGWEG